MDDSSGAALPEKLDDGSFVCDNGDELDYLDVFRNIDDVVEEVVSHSSEGCFEVAKKIDHDVIDKIVAIIKKVFCLFKLDNYMEILDQELQAWFLPQLLLELMDYEIASKSNKNLSVNILIQEYELPSLDILLSKIDITSEVSTHLKTHLKSHILMDFRYSHWNNETSNTTTTLNKVRFEWSDKLQHAKLMYCIGWVLKRVREETSKSTNLKLNIGTHIMSIDKEEVLYVLHKFLSDSKKKDGRYEVVAHSKLLPFFLKLQAKIDSFSLSANCSKLEIHNKNHFLLLAKDLALCHDTRLFWHNTVKEIVGEKGINKEIEVYLYKNLTIFFLKIQPKKLLKQYSLGPNKHSLALRHGIKGESSKSCQKMKIPGKKNNLHHTLPMDQNIVVIKGNFAKPDVVLTALTKLGSCSEEYLLSCLQMLSGHELVVILKAFGLPSFSGKSKLKQAGCLKDFLIASSTLSFKHLEYFDNKKA